MLTEVKQLISARSRLREMALDKLHEGGVEIVSPTFMNTRSLDNERVFIPDIHIDKDVIKTGVDQTAPEKYVFDKAEQAESLENLKLTYESISKEIESLKEQLGQTEAETVKESLQSEINRHSARRDRLAELIKSKENEAPER